MSAILSGISPHPSAPGIPPLNRGGGGASTDGGTKSSDKMAGGFVKVVATLLGSSGTALGLVTVNALIIGASITFSTKKIGHDFEEVVVAELAVLIGG